MAIMFASKAGKHDSQKGIAILSERVLPISYYCLSAILTSELFRNCQLNLRLTNILTQHD